MGITRKRAGYRVPKAGYTPGFIFIRAVRHFGENVGLVRGCRGYSPYIPKVGSCIEIGMR
jgi:hypothetical protein